MLTYQDYLYVYENWYCVSCKKSNETPVPFPVYWKRASDSLIVELKEYLDKGVRP